MSQSHDEKGGGLTVFWTENNLKKTPISPMPASPASPAKEKHQSFISMYMALGQD